MTALRGRVAKLELVGGDEGRPSHDELVAAFRLIGRHFRAVAGPSIGMVFEASLDPVEVAAMKAVETNGWLAKARDAVRREHRACGRCELDQQQQIDEVSSRLREMFGEDL